MAAASADRGAGMNSILTVVGAEIVRDFSFEKKSSWPMVATDVFESDAHLPMEWGCFLA